MARQPGKPWQIYLVPSEGGAVQQPIPAERNERDPSWSPDANSLAFGSFPVPENDNAIRVLDFKTRQATVLAAQKAIGFHAGRPVDALFSP